MNLIFLGAPGAGKGTQAEAVCKKYNIPSISTGNILREAVKNGTDAGKEAEGFMKSGQLVPDEVVIKILQKRISEADAKEGFILDGFPRTTAQANALDEFGIKITKVINIEVPDEEITERMAGRRVCEKCSMSYHIEYKPTKIDGVCDECGGEIIRRVDDAPETVLERLKVYHKKTVPLIDFYTQKGVLETVVGQEEILDTTALVFAALEKI